MKITFITDTLSSGGSERVMSVIANELSKDNVVEIICIRLHTVFYPLENNVKVTFADDYCRKSYLHKFFWLRHYVDRDSIVVAFMVPVYVFVLAALLFSKVRIIVSERNDPDAASLMRRLLRYTLLWRADRLVVQTTNIARKMPLYCQNKIDIIYNPISEKYISGSALNCSKENLIVSIGRLSPQKNQKMMIDGFCELLRQHPEYRLEIYGEGEIHDEIEAYIKEKGAEGKILLMGRNSNLQDVLPKAKMFVLTSDYEGMSNAMIEAMFVGLPVVTTAVSGTEELIENGKNGIIVPIRSKEAFTNAICRLASNEDLMKEMAQEAVKIKDKVTKDAIIKKWRRLLSGSV